MTELELQKSREEHNLWTLLCAQLKELGAVTEKDLKSKLSLKETPGQRLLGLIRVWGDARVELAGIDKKMKRRRERLNDPHRC